MISSDWKTLHPTRPVRKARRYSTTWKIGSGASVSVCPGPICAFRRSVVFELGGFTSRTLAEDFDLTLSAVRHGSRVVFEPRAVAYTDAPATWRQLLRQRIRWCRGGLQVFRQHQALFFRNRHGMLGLFWLPFFLLVGYGGTLFEAAALVALPTLVILSGAPLAMVKSGLVFMGVIEAICVAQYMVAVLLSKNTPRKLALWATIIKPLNLFLSWVRLVAIWQELKGARRCW